MNPEEMHHFKDKRVRVYESWLDGHKSRIIERYYASLLSPDSFPLQSTGPHLLIQLQNGWVCHQASVSPPHSAPIMSKCLSRLLEKSKVEQQPLVSNVVRLVLVFALQNQLLH